MTDKRDSTDGFVTSVYLKEPVNQYPEVVVSCVHFLGDEVQIEQGREQGEIDINTLNNGNHVISVSRAQAEAIANTILSLLGKEKN